MENVDRALRELIRISMRSVGVEHYSDNRGIFSVSYVHTPDKTIKYYGPLLFARVDDCIHCYKYNVVELDIFSEHYYKNIEPEIIRAPVGRIFKDFYRDCNCIFKFQIIDPNLQDKITETIDREIPIINRSHADHKVKVDWGSKKLDGRSIHAVVQDIYNIRPPFFSRVKSAFYELIGFRRYMERDKYLMYHAMARYFGASKKDFNEVCNLAMTLDHFSNSQIERETKLVKSQKSQRNKNGKSK